MRMKFWAYILIFFSVVVFAEQSEQDNLNQDKPWAVLGYYGRLTNNEMLEVLAFDTSFDDETLYSLEVSRELDPNNSLRRFFQPIFSTMSAALNLTYRSGDPVGPIYEIDPYLLFQWTNFPWNNYVKTSIGIGEGLSYVTKVPEIEAENSTDTQNLLNFLMFEIGVAMPSHPEWEILARVHHRSGVFGLYTTGNSGSTAVGLAIRYHF